jgi:ATP-dependent RNA helicase SUPV3L1/SUV3
MPKVPAAGAATLPPGADQRGAALAYRRAGKEWVRIDLADRLASHAHQIRSAGGADPVDSALATSIGLSDDTLAKLMADVGFGRKDGTWTWRGRRDQRRETHKPSSNAFAELAKLRRK